MRGRILGITALLALTCAGCNRSRSASDVAADNAQHRVLHGTVVAVDAAHKKVTISHGEVKNYMPAMTMPFPVENASLLANVKAGDEVDADLVTQNNESYIQSIDVTKASDGRALVSKMSAAHYPQAGEQAHDFHLVTQDDKRVTLASYKGKPLLVDFIYTRCPLPQFCPLLNIKFAEIAHTLQNDQKAYPPAQLLSVSIDPEHDTVPVLKDFSKNFQAMSAPANGDRDWDFATGTPQQVKDLATHMGIDYWQESGQVVHSVVVALIDGNGKIAKMWFGNDWKTGEVLDAIKKL